MLLAYEMISRQAINFHKSCIFFRSNVDDNVRTVISEVFGVSSSIDIGIVSRVTIHDWEIKKFKF